MLFDDLGAPKEQTDRPGLREPDLRRRSAAVLLRASERQPFMPAPTREAPTPVKVAQEAFAPVKAPREEPQGAQVPTSDTPHATRATRAGVPATEYDPGRPPQRPVLAPIDPGPGPAPTLPDPGPTGPGGDSQNQDVGPGGQADQGAHGPTKPGVGLWLGLGAAAFLLFRK